LLTTWKRVATAAGLIPLVVGGVLWGSTWMVAIVTEAVVFLSVFEYFALGDAIDHRAYRFCTATCAWILIYVQWLWAMIQTYKFAEGLSIQHETYYVIGFLPTVEGVFFLYLLGIAALTLWTKRPLVEALPAAGISSSGLLLVAFPLTFAL